MAVYNRKTRLHSMARVATFALAVLAVCFGTVQVVRAAQTAPGADGKTKVNVGVTDLTDKNISYEVPLYYVMTISKKAPGSAEKSEVFLPDRDAYKIVNTSGGSQDVAVTGLSVQSVAGGTWSLTDEKTDLVGSSERKLYMTVGGVVLPSIAAGGSGPQEADLIKAENSFYKGGKYTRMKPKGTDNEAERTLIIPVTAEVSSAYVPENKDATAQFRLIYTVSPLNTDGDVMRAYYNGPVKD